MKVIKATSYGFRTVIVVSHNPNDPDYVHSDESPHPLANVNGCTPDEGQPNVCTSNHQLQEFIFDGLEQYEDGILRSPESFWAEICELCIPSPEPETITGLVGLES